MQRSGLVCALTTPRTDNYPSTTGSLPTPQDYLTTLPDYSLDGSGWMIDRDEPSERIRRESLFHQIMKIARASRHFRNCKQNKQEHNGWTIDEVMISLDDPIESCISDNSSKCIYRACPGNVEIPIPSDIKRSVDMEVFQDEDHLLFSESFLERLKESFRLLYKESNDFYQLMKADDVEGRLYETRHDTHHELKPAPRRSHTSPTKVAFETYRLLSDARCLVDHISAHACILHKELHLLGEVLVSYREHQSSFLNLTHTIETLRCLLEVPFYEFIPHLVMKLQGRNCLLELWNGNSPDGSESRSNLQQTARRMLKIVANLKRVLHKFDKISHSLSAADTTHVKLYD